MSRPGTGRRIDLRRSMIYDGVAFSPLSFGDAFLWLRSDMGVTLAAAKVGAWADQSGAGNNFVQAVDASRFGYVASDANFAGKPSFTMSAAFMQSVAPITAAFANATTVFVFRPTGVAGGVLACTGAGASPGNIQLSYSRFSTYCFGAAGTDRAQVDVNDTVNTKQHAVSTLPFGSLATANPANYRGGALAASTMTTNTATNTTLATATWTIGALPAGAAPVAGSLVEVIAYSKILTTQQISDLYSLYTLPRYGAQGT